MIQRTLFDVLVISLAIFFWSSYSVKSKPIILTHNNEYDDQVRPQLFPNKKRINWWNSFGGINTQSEDFDIGEPLTDKELNCVISVKVGGRY